MSCGRVQIINSLVVSKKVSVYPNNNAFEKKAWNGIPGGCSVQFGNGADNYVATAKTTDAFFNVRPLNSSANLRMGTSFSCIALEFMKAVS